VAVIGIGPQACLYRNTGDKCRVGVFTLYPFPGDVTTDLRMYGEPIGCLSCAVLCCAVSDNSGAVWHISSTAMSQKCVGRLMGMPQSGFARPHHESFQM